MVNQPITLRQRSGPIITVIVWVFCTALLADAAIRGSWETVRTFLPPLALVCWAAYAVLWRPALVVGSDRVTVRDVLRTTVIPFSRVADVRLGPTVAISAHDAPGRERTYRPWNAPGRSQRSMDRDLRSSADADPLVSHPAYGLLRAWRNHLDTPSAAAGEIATSWNIGILGVTLLLIVGVVLGIL